jgi:alkylhydroperoxidase/carboxymuconolactone decarboxylase family protein YurZ
MAKGEAPVLEALADINAGSIERTELQPDSLILVRLAALIAMDAPTASYLAHIGPAAEAGVAPGQVQDVLVAVAPIVGSPRTLAAAAKITEALGLAIDMAETGPDVLSLLRNPRGGLAAARGTDGLRGAHGRA